jgi:phytoene dehydrogenase-like protein
MFGGCAAHAFLPLSHLQTSAMGLMLLASAHVAGWPVVRGGSTRIAEAMAARLAELGGQIETGHRVRSLPRGEGRALRRDPAPAAADLR